MNKLLHWPAALAVFYIVFMLITIGVVIFSTFHRVDLVAEDYYEQEIRYQQQIERILRADSLSVPVRWLYERSQKSLIIKFPPELEAAEIKGNLHFFRPSDARLDRVVPLELSVENSQTLNTAQLLPGLWKLKIFWEINSKEYFTEGIIVI